MPRSYTGDATSGYDLVIRCSDGHTSRTPIAADAIPAAVATLPPPLADELARQAAYLANAASAPAPQVMGICNVTPDSFSDGGRYHDPAKAIAHGLALAAAGATIIDVGGESTRPGAAPVMVEDEIARVVPVIARLAAQGLTVSLDTRRATVAAAGLHAGAAIINDVSGLRHDPGMAAVVAAHQGPVVLMHAPGQGADLHAGGKYDDVVLDVFDALRARRDAALAAGIAAERIWLDPGIGFGKTLAENVALVRNLALFHALGQPLLFGASRKRMIAALAGEGPADQRLGGSLALALAAASAGAAVIRVHDVAETVQALALWRAVTA